MASITFARNPVANQMNPDVQVIVIILEDAPGVIISNGQTVAVEGTSSYAQAGQIYRVTTPFTFPAEVPVTITGPSENGVISVDDAVGGHAEYTAIGMRRPDQEDVSDVVAAES